MTSPEYNPLTVNQIREQLKGYSYTGIQVECDMKSGEPKFLVLAIHKGPITKLDGGDFAKQMSSDYFDFMVDHEEFEAMYVERHLKTTSQ